MIAIEIDQTNPSLMQFLPLNIIQGIRESCCCRCDQEYGQGFIIMYVLCRSGEVRWWHHGNIAGICISKEDTYADLKEVIPTEQLQNMK